MRTVPVNHWAGPLADGCEPARLSCMCFLSKRGVARFLVAPVHGWSDIGAVDLVHPLARRHFLDRDGHGLLSGADVLPDRMDDVPGECSFLLLGRAWPELHDDVRHGVRPAGSWYVAQASIL